MAKKFQRAISESLGIIFSQPLRLLVFAREFGIVDFCDRLPRSAHSAIRLAVAWAAMSVGHMSVVILVRDGIDGYSCAGTGCSAS